MHSQTFDQLSLLTAYYSTNSSIENFDRDRHLWIANTAEMCAEDILHWFYEDLCSGTVRSWPIDPSWGVNKDTIPDIQNAASLLTYAQYSYRVVDVQVKSQSSNS